MQNVEIEAPKALSGFSILPCQYFGPMGGWSALCSEQRLMLAVLVDGLNLLEDLAPISGARRRQDVAEAAKWVITKGTHYLFSFDCVRESLNIAPEVLR